MKAKHTPGPWTFKAIASSGNEEPCRWEILGAGGVVAETNDNTSNADAKLIAASPELFNVLREALAWSKQDATNEDCFPSQDMLDARVHVLTEAIELAKQ